MAHKPTAHDPVDQAAQNLLAKARRAMNDHPEVETLLALQEGKLGSEEEQRVRGHLAQCAECAREVLSLEAFDEPPTGTAPSEVENLASWKLFQQRLAEKATEEEQAPQAMERRETVRRGPLQVGNPWMLAASFLFAVTGLATWWPQVQNQVMEPTSEMEAAQTEALRLRPVGETQRRGFEAVDQTTVPATTDTLVLTLLVADQTPHARYRVEVRNPAGEVALVQHRAPRQKDGSFLLVLPRSLLPDDTYDLLLLGIDGEQEETLAVFRFALLTE